MWAPRFAQASAIVLDMEAWDAIRARRNVRQFADRPLPAADLDRILEAGRRAPSSRNWQPWDFVVVTDRRQLEELAKVWRGADHVARAAAAIACLGLVLDDAMKTKRLPVAGRRRAPARLQDPVEIRRGERSVGELADVAPGLDRIPRLHVEDDSASLREPGCPHWLRPSDARDP